MMATRTAALGATPGARVAQPPGAAQGVAARGARLVAHSGGSRQSLSPFGATQPSAMGGVGDKLLPLIRTPFDLVALPARLALGTLQSLPEVLEKFPADVERLSLLAQDPRPLEEKQAEVLGELEERVVGYLQKGTDTEGELLSGVGAVLPDPLKDVLPEPLKEALRPRPAASSSPSGSSSGSGAAKVKPLATWTITSDAEEAMGLDEMANMPPMTPAAIAASQTAAEVLEVNAAVSELREALSALQGNADPSRSNIVKLNLREAQEVLEGRLSQMAPAHKAVGDAQVQAAIREAEALLEDVRSLDIYP